MIPVSTFLLAWEFLVAIYVDDILLGGNNDTRIKEVRRELSRKFKLKDLGKAHHFLGVAINEQKTGSIYGLVKPLIQESYLKM